jgi:hypothetical protein
MGMYYGTKESLSTFHKALLLRLARGEHDVLLSLGADTLVVRFDPSASAGGASTRVASDHQGVGVVPRRRVGPVTDRTSHPW